MNAGGPTEVFLRILRVGLGRIHGALDANRQGKFLTMAGRCVVEVFIL